MFRAQSLAWVVLIVVSQITSEAEASVPGTELLLRCEPAALSFQDPSAILPVSLAIADSALRASIVSLGGTSVARIFPGYASADTVRMLPDGSTVRLPDLTGYVRVSFTSAPEANTALQELVGQPMIHYAEPNAEVGLDQAALDPYYASDQRYLWDTSIFSINIVPAWDRTRGSGDVRIGILDTGLQYTNDEFGGMFGPGRKVPAGKNFRTQSEDPAQLLEVGGDEHGTRVGGVAGSLINNTRNGQYLQIAGVAGGNFYSHDTNSGYFGVSIVPLAASASPGSGTISNAFAANALVEGSDPARFNCDVINLSWGSDGESQFNNTVQLAINIANQFGCLVVASKGNTGIETTHYPADGADDAIVAVGASTINGTRASFSNWGGNVDLVAPGENILFPLPNVNAPGYSSGTSFAAPLVSGVAALMMSLNPSLHPEDVQGILKWSADDLPPVGPDSQTGFGVVNAGRAVAWLDAPYRLTHHTTVGGASVEVSDAYWQSFVNLGVVYVQRHEVRTSAALPDGFEEGPYVWGLCMNQSTGWRNTTIARQNFETGYTRIIGVSNGVIELATSVFNRVTFGGPTSEWYPCRPESVVFAYSVFGKYAPVTAGIDGPSALGYAEWGVWSAAAAGGDGAYVYEWRWRPDSGSAWSGIVDADPTYTRKMLHSGFELQLTVRSAGMEVATAWVVQYQGDADPPQQVANLLATSNGLSGIDVTWTHPREDEVGTSPCSAYDLRYANTPITGESFGAATAVSPQPVPGAVGSPASYQFTGRDPCSIYYFALKARDEVDNWSPMSNVAQAPPSSPPESCGGGGGGEEDPPVLQHSGRRAEGQAAYRISDGPIAFAVFLGPGQSPAKLEIFDVRGRLLKTIVSGNESPGWHKFSWRFDDNGGSPVAPGVVFTSLSVPGIRRVGKLAILP